MTKYFCLPLLIISSIYCSGQNKSIQNIDNRVEFILDSLQNNFQFPGFAMAIVQDSSIIYEKTYGVKRMGLKDPITSNTQFYWASTSKLFTATAIMKLYEEGKLQLDDPVVKYYPGFKTKKGMYSSDSVTIRHLLTHTSGLKRILDSRELTDPYLKRSPRQALKALKKMELAFEPGTEFLYSNIGIQVLCVVIENISGISCEEYLQSAFLNELDMTHATFFTTNSLKDSSLAAPHIWKGRSIVMDDRIYLNSLSGSGSLRASINDIAIWMKACMEMGLYNKTILLRPETFKTMWQDTIQLNPAKNPPFIAGLTWETGKLMDIRYVSKAGNLIYRSRSYLIIFNDLHLGIAMATNFDFNEWDELSLKIIAAVLENAQGLSEK